ncbi:Rho1 guanine nucleotide exchange factor 3 [Cytospora mali]|uniref:Rho1 guanine nucleotide exchange factor 3 n=1 Tax=Cytospora mali TaxID=578113 RepID=A0A194VH65_CYTMA|nr:Rho1 guanine nucleotide exchange factor 3 [Valsa mali var. pyri (nom. inval.)]
MSFRGDGGRRYGHVPPVQYPVPGQEQTAYPVRTNSFNAGDDAGLIDSDPQSGTDAGRQAEMFMASPAGSLSSYQQRYQGQAQQAPPTPTTYNPQEFAPRAQSTTLPYHTASRFTSPPATMPTSYTPQPANYTPPTYDPSAYAGVSSPQRQQAYQGYNTYAHAYSNSTVPQSSAAPYGQPVNPPYSPTYHQGSISPQIVQSAGSNHQYTASMPSPGQYSTHSTPSLASSGFHSPWGAGNYGQSNGTTSPQVSSYASQAPYPAYAQMPVGPNYSSSDPNAFFNDNRSRAGSQSSPLPSPPTHTQSSTGIARHPTNAPLPSRPVDNVPEEVDFDVMEAYGYERDAQDSLMMDIEAELGGTAAAATAGAVAHRPRPINGNLSDDDLDKLRRYDSRTSTVQGAGEVGVSRNASNASHSNHNNETATYDWDDDEESDQEGAAGLAQMLQDAEEERRFSANVQFSQQSAQPSTTPSLPPPAEEQVSGSDSEYAGGMDIGLYSGGYAGNLTYGNDAATPPLRSTSLQNRERPLPPPPTDQNPPYPDSDSDVGEYAQVDYGGTGGLHRLSFDEGDERVSVHSRASGSESPAKEDLPDLFFHPGLSNRPLPALPPGSDTSSLLSIQSPHRGQYQHGYSQSVDSRAAGLDGNQGQLTAQQLVERSISLSSHSNTPQVQVPGRSRTDAAEERRRALKAQQQQQHALHPGTLQEGYESGTPSSIAYDLITLPTGRKKRFIPEKLTMSDIRRCTEPWALSNIAAWLREMAEGEPDLKRKSIEEGLIKLFTTKVPTMNVADAETLSTMVTDLLYDAGILLEDEEWAKFGEGTMSGVLWQLTGSGCYAPKLHEIEIPGRCYSFHCTRTLKKANLDELMSEESTTHADWATFYKLDKAALDEKPKKESERQNILHEIITGEEDYMGQLDVVRLLYRDQLRAWQPPIIPPAKLNGFIEKVFGKFEAVQQVNKEYLLAQMKYRQNEQGPWIVGFSDIFREWIRKAEGPYLEFSAAYPLAQLAIRKEAARNTIFAQFLEHVRSHKRSNRLGWDTFLKSPITRLQRYSLLLSTSLRKMVQDNEEKTNLIRAIDEIKAVTMKCDDAVARSKSKVDLHVLQTALVLRPGFQSVLNLDHLGRQLIHRGDLTRMGSRGVRWVDTHTLLFDHYFILAKEYPAKDGRDKKYDVSKEPIPMPLLFLESKNDAPISKQKGLTAPLTRPVMVAGGSGTQLNKAISNGDRPSVEHTPSGSSLSSLNTITRINTANDPENTLWPFRVKHLGHEVYTLYAKSENERTDWCNKIIEAKTQHARALYAQNAEPFRLRVLADGAFAYDSFSAAGRTVGVSIKGTPLDRAIGEIEQVYGSGRGPPAVCRASVNCATAFSAFGKSLIAVGTDYGIYISEASNPRGWTRSIQLNRVTQMAVMEEFSVCLVIADRSLISYPLELIAPTSNFPASGHDSARKAPQRLAKDVTFFATARMKERMLVIYKRKEGMHTTFKVLEPVLQRSSEKRPRIFGGRRGGSGSTETFRDFDEFYLPTECYSLNLFQTYIAVATAKGFEMLTLDKKQTMSVPSGLNQPAIANIANRIRDQRPLGMFKLNDQEFLLAYEDCAVYVDKHGEVSRTLIMEYSGKQKKARGATMFGQYLLLFNEDYVEVRNAENGRLRQIVAGRDVRCLDYGVRGPTGGGSVGAGVVMGGAQDSKGTVKIVMSHPEEKTVQIVLELLLNDGHDKAT